MRHECANSGQAGTLPYEKLAAKLKKAVKRGEMTEKEAIAEYRRALADQKRNPK